MSACVVRFHGRSVALWAIVSLLVVARAHAIDTFWSNTRGDGSGTFSAATNWSPSVPGANDVAHFGMTTSSQPIPETYTVAFTVGASNQGLVVEDDRVTFDLSGGSYGTHNNSIGTVSGRTGRLTITNGNWFGNGLTGGTLNIGDAANAAGVLTVSTGATVIRERIDVGIFGPGTLLIQNGGSVTSTSTFIGPQKTGTATVTGTNSRFQLEGLNVGNSSDGTLNVTAGGLLQNSGNAVVGNSDFGVGTINLDGANSSWTNTGTVELARNGEAIVNITGGAHATLAITYIGPVLTTPGPEGGMGKVTVSGVNSQLSGEFTIGGRGNGSGTGELVVSDGGLVQSTGTQLHIAPGGEGKVSVTSGGRIEAINSRVGFGLTGPGVGIASVSGAGSQWINTGNLEVGFFTQGALTLSDGGLVQNVNGDVGATVLSDVGVGIVTVTGATTEWNNTGTLTVAESGTGTLNISAGGVVRSLNGVVGSVAGSVGAVIIDGFSSKWVNAADIHIGMAGDGSVTVSNSGAVQAQNVFVESHGSLGGNGTIIGNVQNSGLVAPGASIGTLEVDGAYAQQPGGVLEIEIGGPSGSHVDLLNVGAATLDGELRLKLIAGIVPELNVALTAVSLSGNFDNVISGQRLTTVDGGGSFVVNYGPGSPFNPNQVVLSNFLATGLPGDYNQNGIVDAADYTLWRDSLGSTNALPNDDTPGVGPDDHDRWKTNFGNSLGSGSSNPQSEIRNPKWMATVPETTTFILALLGAALLHAAAQNR